MPTLIQTLNGTVSGLWGGVALVRGADGKVRVLQLGDKVAKGDVIITTQDGIVELSPDLTLQAAAATPPADADSELDRIIAEVDNPTAETAPAAGLSAGDGGGLQAGLRVDRVAEGTTPAALLPTDYAAAAVTPPVAASETQPEPEQPPAPQEVTLTASAGTVAEGGSLTFTATVATPVTGAPLVLTLTNGATVTIPVGETSGTSAPILVRPDDVQAQGPEAIEVGVAGATGGNGAGLTPTPLVRADVIDDADVTSLTLVSSSSTVGEGGSVVFTVALNAPV
ncbi:MAG: immunoglobulin-like domain-containing protein, partial [Rhizobacter sp.]